MGLLDVFNDPDTGPAARHGLLQMGLAMLQGKGNLGAILGQSGMQGLSGMQQFQGNQFQQQMRKSQLEDIKRKRVLEGRDDTNYADQQNLLNLPLQYIKPAQAGVDATGGMETAATAPNNFVPPSMDLAGLSQAYMGARGGIQQGLGIHQSLQKDESPLIAKEGDVLLNRKNFTPLFTNPKDDRTGDQKDYEAAVKQGYKGGLIDYQREMANLKAPKTSVNVSTEKPFMAALAGGLGKQLDAGLESAKAAQSSIRTAHQIKEAIDSGKVITGPGSTFRIVGLQLGQTLGIGGKDSAEILNKTRTVMQSMAQAELDAAQQMKGQGQITEAERDIIRRAAAGDINSLTGAETKLLADTMEKTARYKINQHKKNVEGLAKMPNAAPLLPFYQIEEPPPYSGKTGVRRYNPATGKLE